MKILCIQLSPHVLPALVRGLSNSVGPLILAQDRHWRARPGPWRWHCWDRCSECCNSSDSWISQDPEDKLSVCVDERFSTKQVSPFPHQWPHCHHITIIITFTLSLAQVTTLHWMFDTKIGVGMHLCAYFTIMFVCLSELTLLTLTAVLLDISVPKQVYLQSIHLTRLVSRLHKSKAIAEWVALHWAVFCRVWLFTK